MVEKTEPAKKDIIQKQAALQGPRNAFKGLEPASESVVAAKGGAQKPLSEEHAAKLEACKEKLKCLKRGMYDAEEVCRDLLYCIKESKNPGPFMETLSSAVDALISTTGEGRGVSDFQNWSHSVCHLFEHYDAEDEYSHGFLCQEETLELGAKLVDEAVKRSVALRDYGCMDRIVRPIAVFNLHHTPPDKVDSFAFKPSSLDNPEFAAVMRDNLYTQKYLVPFLESASVKEFIEKVASAKVSLYESYRPGTSKTLGLLLTILEGALGPEKAKDYWVRVCKVGVSPEDFRANVPEAEQASVLVEAAFFDIDGTLINLSGGLERNIYSKLAEAYNSGKTVVIFTGGDVEEQKARLRELGMDEKLVSFVKSKKEFVGKRLEEVWDDTFPEIQGFAAVKFHFVY